MADRLPPPWPAAFLAQRRVDPFRQCREAIERRPDRLLHNARREARGQRVDRLDRSEAVEFVGPQHEVGVGHLRHAPVELDAAADDTLGADREQPRELIALHIKINEGQRAGAVCAQHAVGPAPEARLVRLDAHRDCRDAVGLERADGRRGAAVDDAARQMPDKVEDERAGEALEQLGRLRADAGQRRHRRKQLVEDGGTHPRCLYPREGIAKGRPRDLTIRNSPQEAVVPLLASRHARERPDPRSFRRCSSRRV